MDSLNLKVESVTQPSHVLKFGYMRISVLSSKLIRVEKWIYRDEPTQKVWFRNFSQPEFSVQKNGTSLTIKTLDCTFVVTINGNVFATLKDGTKLSKKGNLLGTARTLDNKNGKTKLDKGIVAKGGLAVLDDSDSLIIESENILPYTFACDKYYFAFGDDYRGALKTFYQLTGEVPLIPKYALGNWWSRYKAYTQQEYIDLMQKFIDKQIPITVATIDMDWHWVDVVNRFGKESTNIHSLCFLDKMFSKLMPGWTGYSWNTELFPNHKALFDWLKQNGMHIPLNIHPSQGIRFFEEQYKAVCEHVGIDYQSKEPVAFDLSNHKFLQAYFELVHRPMEDEGVDCWWIDWQQGKKSQIKGLDPLWGLNHYHYLDMARGEKRPLILSRFAKIGSHRYPLGFSGDTVISWKSLDFQPYFTANAANVGYTWWSHDIGGHRSGTKNEELYLRWLQFGVFSPINRLHSTANEFSGKEPWKNSKYIEDISTKFLRLRHKMIPFLYSANYNSYKNGIAICEPLYYSYKQKQAYENKNEYIFGGKLLCCPITKPLDKITGLADCEVWLPENVRYTDIFTGNSYMGGKKYTMYRDLQSFPCLAKEGTILPFYQNDTTNSLGETQPLEVWIYRGTGSFSLYEDDGETNNFKNGDYTISTFAINEKPNGYAFIFKTGVEGSKSVIDREIRLIFKDILSADILVNGVAYQSNENVVTIKIQGDATIELTNCTYPKSKDKKQLIVSTITKYQMKNSLKTMKFLPFVNGKTQKPLCGKRLYGPIKEIQEIL